MNSKNGTFKPKKIYFSQVSNHAIRDEKLTLQAKGLYSLIQSYITIENFVLYKGMLTKNSKAGKHAFNSAWKELKDTGYLLQERHSDGKGKFCYTYELLDKPLVDSESNPCTDYPHTGYPCTVNRGHSNNTDCNNTDLNNIKENNKGGNYKEFPRLFLFFNIYECKTGNSHPFIKLEQMKKVEESMQHFMEENDLDIEDMEVLIGKYFSTNFSSGTDYNVNHFATYEIMKNRLYEELY